ncbi:TPA: hypothetical protein ACH3X1_010843 [Trebouxia sp. C0004]
MRREGLKNIGATSAKNPSRTTVALRSMKQARHTVHCNLLLPQGADTDPLDAQPDRRQWHATGAQQEPDDPDSSEPQLESAVREAAQPRGFNCHLFFEISRWDAHAIPRHCVYCKLHAAVHAAVLYCAWA